MRFLRTAALALGAFAVTSLSASCGADRPLGAKPGLALNPTTAYLLPSVRISEIHYDNSGADAGEAIEVSGPAGTNLSGYRLVLYNGAGGAIYNTTLLSGVIPASCAGGTRGVLVFTIGGIQNGDPDGVALATGTTNASLIEFLSYGGTFAGVGGAAGGVTSIDIGVKEGSSTPVGHSLQRSGAGDNVWSAPAANTFGACNDVAPPAVASVTIDPTEATIDEGTTQQFTARAFDASNTEITGSVAFTWTSSATGVAIVSNTGLATGVNGGTANITVSSGGRSAVAALTVNDLVEGPVEIVEIHYDNDGTDVGEAIEVMGLAGQSLAGWSLVLYNQTGGSAYNTLALSGKIPDQCGGKGTLAFTYPSNGIQNGPADGVALVKPGNVVVQFLSYEGTLTALNGPATGLTSIDIGVDEPASSPVGRSIQKDDIGWYGPNPQSFGACNAALPPFVSIGGRGTLPVGFEDQFFATLNDGRGNTSPSTFTWSSETPALASIDADGVAHALAAGTVTLRATAADGTSGTTTFSAFDATAGAATYASHVEFGTPADADASDEVIISRTEYTSSFSRTRGIPNWVSFNLEASHFGSEDRCNCFTFDPLIGGAWPRYTTADYTGAGAFAGYGIDRGHLARSFDRTSGSLDNARTFYFSNIIPQASDNNQGPWAEMEIAVGDMARFQNKELFIIAGASGSKGTVKNEGLITIPAFTWKVVLVLPRDQGLANVDSWDDVDVIAVIMPNDPGIRNVPWETYKTTVDAVEALSGYDLLSLLPDDVEGIVESPIRNALALVDGFVQDGTLNKGNGNALSVKLEAAAKALFNGNLEAMKGELGAFLNQVDAFEKIRKLSASQASALRAAVS